MEGVWQENWSEVMCFQEEGWRSSGTVLPMVTWGTADGRGVGTVAGESVFLRSCQRVSMLPGGHI
jgi:hypothetical protein